MVPTSSNDPLQGEHIRAWVVRTVIKEFRFSGRWGKQLAVMVGEVLADTPLRILTKTIPRINESSTTLELDVEKHLCNVGPEERRVVFEEINTRGKVGQDRGAGPMFYDELLEPECDSIALYL